MLMRRNSVLKYSCTLQTTSEFIHVHPPEARDPIVNDVHNATAKMSATANKMRKKRKGFLSRFRLPQVKNTKTLLTRAKTAITDKITQNTILMVLSAMFEINLKFLTFWFQYEYVHRITRAKYPDQFPIYPSRLLSQRFYNSFMVCHTFIHLYTK